MYKALAVLRTLYLVFIVGYTIRAMPIFTSVSNTFDEQYARCSSSLNLVVRAAWLAIAWIAFETIVGWLLASRSRPASRAAVPPAPLPRPARCPAREECCVPCHAPRSPTDNCTRVAASYDCPRNAARYRSATS